MNKPNRVRAWVLLGFVITAMACAGSTSDDPTSPGLPERDDPDPMSRPEVAPSELTRRADEFLVSLGIDPGAHVRLIAPQSRADVVQALRKKFSNDEVLDFWRRGAPLARWRVAYLPRAGKDSPLHELSVTLDERGRIRGFHATRPAPYVYPDGPFEDWFEAVLPRTAAWMQIPIERFEPAGRYDARETNSKRLYAGWMIKGLTLGDQQVVVLVDHGPDSYNCYEAFTPVVEAVQ